MTLKPKTLSVFAFFATTTFKAWLLGKISNLCGGEITYGNVAMALLGFAACTFLIFMAIIVCACLWLGTAM